MAAALRHFRPAGCRNVAAAGAGGAAATLKIVSYNILANKYAMTGYVAVTVPILADNPSARFAHSCNYLFAAADHCCKVGQPIVRVAKS